MGLVIVLWEGSWVVSDFSCCRHPLICMASVLQTECQYSTEKISEIGYPFVILIERL